MKMHRPNSHRRPRGFTLIEVMIVTIVVGVLAAVAYPSFMSQLRKSRRSDAVDAMTRVQQAQERWRANNPTYTGTLSSLTPAIAATSAGGYYGVATAVTNAASNNSYTVTATAVNGKSQASDKEGAQSCATLTVTVAAGTPSYTPAACWIR